MKMKERINKMNTENKTIELNFPEEIASKLSSGFTEKQVLEKGFEIGVEILFPMYGEKTRKHMQKLYWYDEDFCSDLVSAYFNFERNR